MLRAQTYRKMQIGLGVLLVAAVLLTLVAAAWPLMTAHAQGAPPGNHITPKWTTCTKHICYYWERTCDYAHPWKEWELVKCYSEGRGWYWVWVCTDCYP